MGECPLSTVRKPRRSSLEPSPDDPYFYGFRYVERPDLDGQEHTVIEPLTEEDVLHPQEGDHITQNDQHGLDCNYLRNVLSANVTHIPHPVVLGDCLIDLGVKRVKPLASDAAVFADVPTRRLWSTFRVRDEGARWVLVGEVTSPATRDKDLHVKPRLYYQAGVPLYFIVDQESVRGGVRQLRLIGYERGRRAYRRMRLNAEGRLWLEPVQLWLGVEGGRVVCYDASGRAIEDYAELEQARADAEERIRQLEEELRRLREGR